MIGDSSKSILKSTTLIGSSKVLSMIINLIKSKYIAVVLGPSGTGMVGIFQSTISLVQTLGGLGIQYSAVRDIAQAYAQKDQFKIAQVVISLRSVVFFTGFLGFLLTIIFANNLSIFAFGEAQYSWHIKILSLAVFFNLISSGEMSLIQGRRQIKDLAKLSVLIALIGTIVAIPSIYLFKLDGILIFLISQSFFQFIMIYHFARKIKVINIKLKFYEIWQNINQMVKLGLAFMGSALATVITTYLIKVFIIREINLSAAGIYQAAFAISGLYIGIILQAMAKDFYPQLAAIAFKAEKEIDLINQQVSIGMILAAPGLLFTLALSPILIKLLYTYEYFDAYPILQWMIFGIFLRTISWPMAYILVARAKSIIFFITEIITNLVHLLLIYFLIKKYGIIGTGIAFFVMYFFYSFFIYFLIKLENGFSWSPEVFKQISLYGIIFLISFIILKNMSLMISSLVVSCIGLWASFMAVRKIMEIMEINNFSNLLKLLKSKIG